VSDYSTSRQNLRMINKPVLKKLVLRKLLRTLHDHELLLYKPLLHKEVQEREEIVQDGRALSSLITARLQASSPCNSMGTANSRCRELCGAQLIYVTRHHTHLLQTGIDFQRLRYKARRRYVEESLKEISKIFTNLPNHKITSSKW
jgi:hypothetical protein